MKFTLINKTELLMKSRKTKLAPKLEASTDTLKIGEDLSLSAETTAITNFKQSYQQFTS